MRNAAEDEISIADKSLQKTAKQPDPLNCTPSVRQKKRGQVDRHRLCQDGRRLYTGGAGEAEVGSAGEQPAEE
jgi:hypothetical protein